MWGIDPRIDAMETRIKHLEDQIGALPHQVEESVKRALESHESREKEWIGAVSEKISSSILVGLLGEDLVLGSDSAKNKRALQQVLRQAVLAAPLIVRLQTRVFIIGCMVMVGIVAIATTSAGILLEFIKAKFGFGFGS